MLKRLLQKRLSVLQKNVSLIKLRIDKYPQGYLKINKKNGEFYYRIVSNIIDIDVNSVQENNMITVEINENKITLLNQFILGYMNLCLN